ncbi:MAG: hypothetical protein ACI4TA_08645 [Acetatifactor sp.]
MGIGMINDYSSFLKNYQVPVIPRVSVDDVLEQERVASEQSVQMPAHETPGEVRPPRQDAPLEDISVVFNKKDDFGYLGQNKDIRSLDVEKAIDDMRKDKVLQQYQYFVGNARNIQTESADGVVVRKF